MAIGAGWINPPVTTTVFSSSMAQAWLQKKISQCYVQCEALPSCLTQEKKRESVGFSMFALREKEENKFVLLWGEAQLCLPYVCL